MDNWPKPVLTLSFPTRSPQAPQVLVIILPRGSVIEELQHTSVWGKLGIAVGQTKDVLSKLFMLFSKSIQPRSVPELFMRLGGWPVLTSTIYICTPKEWTCTTIAAFGSGERPEIQNPSAVKAISGPPASAKACIYT